MKSVFTLSLIFTFFGAQAQFAFVEDKDGYSNIRDSASGASRIQSRVMNGDIVFCFDLTGDWYNVDYYTKPENGNGYIHQSRLKMIDAFPALAADRKGKDSIVFWGDSLKISVSVTPFVAQNYQLQYKKSDGYRFLSKINHRAFWGTDGAIPTLQYKRISCVWKGREVPVPDSALWDVFNPNLHMTQVRYDRQHQRWFLQATNSDGAGGYEVIWMFEKGEYKRRFVCYGF
jgi:hypothetical protein